MVLRVYPVNLDFLSCWYFSGEFGLELQSTEERITRATVSPCTMIEKITTP
jgi:hypothetical protein